MFDTYEWRDQKRLEKNKELCKEHEENVTDIIYCADCMREINQFDELANCKMRDHDVTIYYKCGCCGRDDHDTYEQAWNCCCPAEIEI